MADDKKLNNIRILRDIRVCGKVVEKGDVIAKTTFANKSDWQNLCNMQPARCAETDKKVGKADKEQMPKAASR